MRLGEIEKIASGDHWIIPRYNEVLREDPSTVAQLRALAKIMDRPIRNRRGSFSASGAGGCLRARQFQFAGKEQIKPDEKALNIFENGDFFHLRMQVAGIIGGYLTGAEVGYRMPIKGTGMELVGTLDGITSEDEIAEFKSINMNGFSQIKKFGPKRDHVYQVHAYMLLTGMRIARIVYENKNTQDLKEFYVEADDDTLLSVEMELDDLAHATEAKELLPMLEKCVTEGVDKWCPYRKICPEQTSISVFGSDEPHRKRFVIQRASSTPSV